MKSSHTLRAAVALALGLAVSPAFADEAALKAEVDALRAAISEQRALLDSQAKLLEAQQAQLEALSRQLGQPKVAAAETQKSRRSRVTETHVQQQPAHHYRCRRQVLVRGSRQRAARWRACMAKTRKVRSPRTIAAARSARLTIAKTTPRVTSVMASISAAPVSASKAPSRSEFNYRLLLELGGSGTEGPTRINDAWIAYTGLAPFTFQLGAFSPPANMDDGTSPEDLAFLERASASELSRSLGGADGRIGLGLKANGKRWMSAFTITTRTVNDAEVFDGQLAAVGRAGGLIATGSDYNVHLGASGTYVFSPADQGSSAAPPRHAIRFRDRPEIRVDSVRLIDTGAIDAAHASVLGMEFGANWKSFYLQGEHFWFDVERRGAAALPDPDFAGYYVQGSWMLTGESRRYNPVTGSFQNPRPKEIVLARRRRRRVGTRRALQQHEPEFSGRRWKASRRCRAACAAASRTCSRSA